MTLDVLGTNPFVEQCFASAAASGLELGRVCREDRGKYLVCDGRAELAAEVSGKFRHQARSRADYPAVGDWVALQARPDEGTATIHGVLPRKSVFSRKNAGAVTEEQVVAANVDVVFLVSGLDHDFNVRRIERYLSLAWESGASPVIVLNKADLCPDALEARIAESEAVAMGVPIEAASAAGSPGVGALRKFLSDGVTAAFLGSSGVGKSSLINALIGYSRQHVNEVRGDDSRGRHTTTRRELIVLPEGGIVIDTPGMRELQLWASEESVDRVFEDIDRLAGRCRFRDCTHEAEPGCAVLAAIESGDLPAERFQSFMKLKRELRYLERKQDVRARQLEEAKWRRIAMEQRRISKARDRSR